MKCKLVDVFARQKLSGNGLTIFYDFENLTTQEMLSLTQEMRQFESIFVVREDDGFYARIFTTEEELDFAGHPLIGLSAHLHEVYGEQELHCWSVRLNKKTVKLHSHKAGEYFAATMDQGTPEFIKQLSHSESEPFLSSMNLSENHLSSLPMEVISTGLPYLIIPVNSNGLQIARVSIDNLEDLLAQHGAKFAYILDTDNLEGRTWDNQGKVEDIATGSAAGPAAAFLYKHGRVNGAESFVLRQGRFAGRDSEMHLKLDLETDEISNISVSGQVCKIADIEFV
jgi:trans-2,3-dihydro-3-hydroxyanthranilate isomerase